MFALVPLVSQATALADNLEVQAKSYKELAGLEVPSEDTGDEDFESPRRWPFPPFRLSDTRRIQIGLPLVHYEKVRE